MTDSMGPGKLVCHMQNPSYTYDEYLICIGLGPSISSVICKNPSYSGPSYPSSPVYIYIYIYVCVCIYVYDICMICEQEKRGSHRLLQNLHLSCGLLYTKFYYVLWIGDY